MSTKPNGRDCGGPEPAFRSGVSRPLTTDEECNARERRTVDAIRATAEFAHPRRLATAHVRCASDRTAPRLSPAVLTDDPRIWQSARALGATVIRAGTPEYARLKAHNKQRRHGGMAGDIAPPPLPDIGPLEPYPPLEEYLSCEPGTPDCEHFYLTIPGFVGSMPYVSHAASASGYATSGNLLGPQDENVRHVIVSIHGRSDVDVSDVVRSPGQFYFKVAHAAIRTAGSIYAQSPHEVAVIAPVFQTTRYMPFTDADWFCWYWSTNENWVDGDQSRTFSFLDLWYDVPDLPDGWVYIVPQGFGDLARPSSHRVLNEMLVRAVQKYPNLEHIVVAGHSAGGQCVQRYAVTSRAVVESLSVPVRFLVGNPGSYCYFTRQRLIPGNKDGIVVSGQIESEPPTEPIWKVPGICPGYDKWGWGVANVDDFPLRHGAGAALDHAKNTIPNYYGAADDDHDILLGWLYSRQDVWHLQSTADTVVAKPGTQCEYLQQGLSRMDRFLNFQRSLHERPPPNVTFPSARFRFVHGIHEHSGFALFTAPDGLEALWLT